MSKIITLTNNNSVEEAAYSSDYFDVGGSGVTESANPGAKTGPYGDGKRDTDIDIPVFQSNIQVTLKAQQSFSFETDDYKVIAFYEEYARENENITIDIANAEDFTVIGYQAVLNIKDGTDPTAYEWAVEPTTVAVDPASGKYDEEVTTQYTYGSVAPEGYKFPEEDYNQFFAVAGDVSESLSDVSEALTLLQSTPDKWKNLTATDNPAFTVTEFDLEDIAGKVVTVVYVQVVTPST